LEKQKKKLNPPFDISIRLPLGKKHLKEKLVKMAADNGISMTTLVIYIFEWFFEERQKGKAFTIRLK
jgi:hypothetical protein